MSFLVEFIPSPGSPTPDGWPTEIEDKSDGILKLGLTWNREPLNQGEASYIDQRGAVYVLIRLRSGHIVGAIDDDQEVSTCETHGAVMPCDRCAPPRRALGYLVNESGDKAWRGEK
jgi:hypothetical protein